MKKNNINVAIVGTPIGNLDDLSIRVINVLSESDIIFAEDTRTALKLLNKLKIKKTIHSYHKDNEKEKIDKIIKDIKSGLRIVIISEAGMPCISDPGSLIVKKLINEDIKFEIVSGPTALIHGLIASGFSGGSFYFHGFLPHKESHKKDIIKKLINISTPIIFYESPHRVKSSLKLLLDYFPTPIACSRELTKLYEETIFINSIEDIENIKDKGEFVITVDNSRALKDHNNNDFVLITKKLLKDNITTQDIIKVLKALGLKRNLAYKLVQDISKI